MKIFDAHCDTLSAGFDLGRGAGQFDTQRAIARGGGVQVMAAFGADQEGQLRRLSGYVTDCREALERGALALIPALEGGDAVTSLEDAERLIGLGVRFFGLTWNNDNALGGGCLGSSGLTALGRGVTELCENRGVTVDLAHASKQTFWDVLNRAKRPPAVTHACAETLRAHMRNLDDSQLRALGERGGVVGITFYVPFLTDTPSLAFDALIAHFRHAVSIAGEDAVGIGSDFDGCDALPPGLEDTSRLPALIERLPFPGRIKDKIAYGNFRRLITE
ncbi:MAG: membrane dipeptidase [Oscillospiraceae bacterium]|nr:membrane dipeptidase [Oscillospiraceae bacterium]